MSELACYSNAELNRQLEDMQSIIRKLIVTINSVPDLKEVMCKLADECRDENDEPANPIDAFLRLVELDREAANNVLLLSLPTLVNLHGIEMVKWELGERARRN